MAPAAEERETTRKRHEEAGRAREGEAQRHCQRETQLVLVVLLTAMLEEKGHVEGEAWEKAHLHPLQRRLIVQATRLQVMGRVAGDRVGEDEVLPHHQLQTGRQAVERGVKGKGHAEEGEVQLQDQKLLLAGLAAQKLVVTGRHVTGHEEEEAWVTQLPDPQLTVEAVEMGLVVGDRAGVGGGRVNRLPQTAQQVDERGAKGKDHVVGEGEGRAIQQVHQL